MRTQLTSIPDFTPQSAFERIDRNQSGEISAQEIIDFLKENAITHVDLHEAQHLINFYDCNGSQTLDASETSQMFLPCENNELREDATMRNIGKILPNMRLPSNNEMLMCKIIEQEIDLIRQLEHIKAVLQREPGFNSFAIFREIDVDGDGQINKEEVADFLKETGYEANESECLAIVRRMDTNGNWHVSYEEFIDF